MVVSHWSGVEVLGCVGEGYPGLVASGVVGGLVSSWLISRVM